MLETFSNELTIQFEFELEELEALRQFLELKKLEYQFEYEKMSITIDQDKQNEKEILSELYRQFSINKMDVGRASVEDIVRRIYTK